MSDSFIQNSLTTENLAMHVRKVSDAV